MVEETPFLRMLREEGISCKGDENPKIKWVLRPDPLFDGGWLLIGELEDGKSVFLHKKTEKICQIYRN